MADWLRFTQCVIRTVRHCQSKTDPLQFYSPGGGSEVDKLLLIFVSYFKVGWHEHLTTWTHMFINRGWHLMGDWAEAMWYDTWVAGAPVAHCR